MENGGLLRKSGSAAALAALLLTLRVAAVGANEPIDLDDLSAFAPAAANWTIAGGVHVDPEKTHHLEATEGVGVLVNRPTADARGNLLSRVEHGDADLELQFMMAPGSNSGIYLQGRYEVQLLDSWGKQHPKYSDCGGIYQRRRADGSQYEGAAPRINACKAPGLWQTLRIAFQAPKFDDNGQKLSNARFLSVHINGVPVHENLEVTGPTGGAIAEEEASLGPLTIQGDHGPLALRNIRLRTYGSTPPALDLGYRVYYDSAQHPLEGFDGLADREPDEEGRLALLSHQLSRFPDGFAIVFDGSLEVPAAGTYELAFLHMGEGWLDIDGKRVLETVTEFDPRALRHASVSLTPGRHPFRAGYLKKGELDWQRARPPVLALLISGPGFRQTALHRIGALDIPTADPILIDADTPRIIRSFVDAGPDTEPTRRIVHAINVGSPDALHYTLDYDQGTIVQVWRGDFLDATPMWFQRGDGSSRARGAVEFMTFGRLLAMFQNGGGSGPERHTAPDIRPAGYRLLRPACRHFTTG